MQANSKTYQFTTGSTYLPDVGKLSYNGCTFSPLFETKVSGKVVKDNSGRTTKLMEYVITVDGYVTLSELLANNINPAMVTLRKLLTAQGGVLIYNGRGFDLVINNFGGVKPVNLNATIGQLAVNASLADVAWGPVPELLEFQPLGGGLSAKVQWRVTVRIPEVSVKGRGLLQLNYETVVTYNEDYFSTIAVRGTLEIPMTRIPSQGTRDLSYTVDDYRSVLEERITKGIDLSRFRITRREFAVSRDKRTMEWEFTAEELPYMDMPPDCTIARGSYNVRPAKAGMGLVLWLCTLRATYTVRPGVKRREAWLSFLALLRLRMNYSKFGEMPDIKSAEAPKKPGFFKLLGRTVLAQFFPGTVPDLAKAILNAPNVPDGTPFPTRRVWIIDFQIDEGLYLDSKTISFSATWRIITKFSSILLASGLWRKTPDQDPNGKSLWAISMKDVSGIKSWLPNGLDPELDVIVDFGGPDAIQGQ